MTAERGFTIRECREQIGIPLSPRDFVTEPGDRIRLYMPFPIVKKHLMESAAADRAEAALNECVRIAGGQGQRLYLANAEEVQEFEEAAQDFEEATGVEVSEVFALAQSRLDTLMAQSGVGY